MPNLPVVVINLVFKFHRFLFFIIPKLLAGNQMSSADRDDEEIPIYEKIFLWSYKKRSPYTCIIHITINNLDMKTTIIKTVNQ